MLKTMQLIIIFIVCCTALPATAFAGGVITRMSDRQTVSFSQMMAETEKADVILVAESPRQQKASRNTT